MSSLNGRSVTIARVHASVHFEGVGSLSSPITPNSARTNGSLRLTRVEGGLLLETTTKAEAKAQGKSLFVPDGNIQSLQLGPEQKVD